MSDQFKGIPPFFKEEEKLLISFHEGKKLEIKRRNRGKAIILMMIILHETIKRVS